MKSDDCKYFRWLTDQIDDGSGRVKKYRHLLSDLFDISYKWVIELDSNRAVDGMNLREKYRADYERDMGCSVLEMLIAMCVRFEYSVASEPGEEDPSRWFWLIIERLDLDLYSDECYDFEAVNSILELWMSCQKFFCDEKYAKKTDQWFQLQSLLNDDF